MCVFIILQYKYTTFITKVFLQLINTPLTYLRDIELPELKEVDMLVF